MRDFIRGDVTQVVDGKTIEVKVTQIGRNNRYEYRGNERIHISEIKPFLIVRKCGDAWKPFLEQILLGKGITCLVHTRGPDGHIEGDVFLL